MGAFACLLFPVMKSAEPPHGLKKFPQRTKILAFNVPTTTVKKKTHKRNQNCFFRQSLPGFKAPMNIMWIFAAKGKH